MINKLILFIALFFTSYTNCQVPEDNGALTFAHCFCLEHQSDSIVFDTSADLRTINVSCRLKSGRNLVNYSLKKFGSEYLLDGYLHLYSSLLPEKRVYFGMFEQGNITGASIVTGRAGRAYNCTIGYYDVHNDTLNGAVVEYCDNIIYRTGYYKNGVRDSIWTYYHPNFKVKSKGRYQNKRITISFCKETWELLEIENNKDTIATYPLSSYKDLLLKYQHDDKGVMAFPIYIEFKTGVWEHYDLDGILIRREWYEDGRLIKTE
jgi:antitoxin component YwqK of YwqJK toxin-antitoxin module